MAAVCAPHVYGVVFLVGDIPHTLHALQIQKKKKKNYFIKTRDVALRTQVGLMRGHWYLHFFCNLHTNPVALSVFVSHFRICFGMIYPKCHDYWCAPFSWTIVGQFAWDKLTRKYVCSWLLRSKWLSGQIRCSFCDQHSLQLEMKCERDCNGILTKFTVCPSYALDLLLVFCTLVLLTKTETRISFAWTYLSCSQAAASAISTHFVASAAHMKIQIRKRFYSFSCS